MQSKDGRTAEEIIRNSSAADSVAVCRKLLQAIGDGLVWETLENDWKERGEDNWSQFCLPDYNRTSLTRHVAVLETHLDDLAASLVEGATYGALRAQTSLVEDYLEMLTNALKGAGAVRSATASDALEIMFGEHVVPEIYRPTLKRELVED